MLGLQHFDPRTISTNALVGVHWTKVMTIDTIVMAQYIARLEYMNHLCQRLRGPRILNIKNAILDLPTTGVKALNGRLSTLYFKA